MALEAEDKQKRRRTAETAQRAYVTITRLKEDTNLGDADKEKLEANLQRLKSKLQHLGKSL